MSAVCTLTLTRDEVSSLELRKSVAMTASQALGEIPSIPEKVHPRKSVRLCLSMEVQTRFGRRASGIRAGTRTPALHG